MADSYRARTYNVDYSTPSSQTASSLSQQLQQAYSSPSQPQHRPSSDLQRHHQHQGSYSAHPAYEQQHSTSQHHDQTPSILHHNGVTPGGGNRTPVMPHGHLPSRSLGLSQSKTDYQQPPQQPGQQQVSLDLHNHHRLSHGGFGTSASSVTTSLYGSGVSTPNACTQSPYASYSANKRSRPDEFDLATNGVDQSGLEGVQAAAAAAAAVYSAGPHEHQTPVQGQSPASASSAASSQHSQPQMHHHHHLPDLDSPSRGMRNDERGGAPSVVGQEGMPAPAPRPRGPKLKFTAHDDQLLVDLKENKSLTWKQIADFFPGRTHGTLQVRYCTKLKAKTTLWTDEADAKLLKAIQDHENEKWRFVAHRVGPGFSPAACRERSAQLSGEEPEPMWQSPTPPRATSLPESMELTQTQQRPW
ncbi:hypothetical protein CDD82_508 [Ophiocordyceps australis]|uniref:Myb-like domain-containing protein n=1 Tax=Ophiocordyceps australis TaxID=1399860 RepID=A0A2C5YG58_9HYPO|nr:hypothetical protein CDD82_508 [Ophiocordyceps australis]